MHEYLENRASNVRRLMTAPSPHGRITFASVSRWFLVRRSVNRSLGQHYLTLLARTVSISTARGGDQPRYAWTYKPWRPGVEDYPTVGTTWVASKLGGLNIKEVPAAPKIKACKKSFCGNTCQVPTH